VRFQLRLPVPGTLCRSLSEMYSHWQPFDSSWRPYYSGHPSARMLIS